MSTVSTYIICIQWLKFKKKTTITITIYICIARLYSAVQGRLTVLQTVKHKNRTVKNSTTVTVLLTGQYEGGECAWTSEPAAPEDATRKDDVTNKRLRRIRLLHNHHRCPWNYNHLLRSKSFNWVVGRRARWGRGNDRCLLLGVIATWLFLYWVRRRCLGHIFDKTDNFHDLSIDLDNHTSTTASHAACAQYAHH